MKWYPFCGRRLAFHYTNLSNTTQKYPTDPEKWYSLYRYFLVLVEIYIQFASTIDILTWPYSSLLGCYLQGFWFGLPQNISVSAVGRRERIRMAAPIDTVMMKYRRQGPDEREDQGGWPRVPSISTHRVLLLQASVMWCGGEQYCWHSQLESCWDLLYIQAAGREGPLFIRHFFFLSLFLIRVHLSFSLFVFTFVSSACIWIIVSLLLFSFFYIFFLLVILNNFRCL